MELKTIELEFIDNEFVSKVYQELQESLLQGWQSFNKDKSFQILKDFFDFLLKAGFDESKYRKSIPNPAYDNAAKLIGKPFLETARNLEIHFDEIFPGSFSTSQEVQETNYEVRVFTLKAFYRNKPLCLFLLKFSHFHQSLGFPLPPELKIIELY
jgi:hypothetical protein